MARIQESEITSPVEQVLTRFRAGLTGSDVPKSVCRAIEQLIAGGKLSDREAIYVAIKGALAEKSDADSDA